MSSCEEGSLIWTLLATVQATFLIVLSLLIIIHPIIVFAALICLNQFGNPILNYICYIVFLVDVGASALLGIYMNYLREQFKSN